LPAAALGWGSDRPNTGLHPSFTANPPEQAGLGLTQDHELGIVLGHPEEIQHDLLGFGQ
jgi:hypothetical protein